MTHVRWKRGRSVAFAPRRTCGGGRPCRAAGGPPEVTDGPSEVRPRGWGARSGMRDGGRRRALAGEASSVAARPRELGGQAGGGGAGASGPRRWGRARTEPPGRSPRRSRRRRVGDDGRHGRGGRSVRARSGRTGAAPVPGARTHSVRRRATLPPRPSVRTPPSRSRHRTDGGRPWHRVPRGGVRAETRRPAPSVVARRTLRRSDTPCVPVPWPDRRAAVIRPTPSVRCPPGGPEGQKALGAGYGGRHHECFAEFR